MKNAVVWANLKHSGFTDSNNIVKKKKEKKAHSHPVFAIPCKHLQDAFSDGQRQETLQDTWRIQGENDHSSYSIFHVLPKV